MIRPPETLSLHEKDMVLPGDAEFQAFRNAVGALDEMPRRNGRTDLMRSLLE